MCARGSIPRQRHWRQVAYDPSSPSPASEAGNMRCDLDKLCGDDLFGIQCLPYGVFQPSDGSAARIGTRLGDYVLDLHGIIGDAYLSKASLNPLMEQGRGTWRELRGRIIESLELPRF